MVILPCYYFWSLDGLFVGDLLVSVPHHLINNHTVMEVVVLKFWVFAPKPKQDVELWLQNQFLFFVFVICAMWCFTVLGNRFWVSGCLFLSLWDVPTASNKPLCYPHIYKYVFSCLYIYYVFILYFYFYICQKELCTVYWHTCVVSMSAWFFLAYFTFYFKGWLASIIATRRGRHAFGQSLSAPGFVMGNLGSRVAVVVW